MLRGIILSFCLVSPAAAEGWLCLGTYPGFMMTIAGDRATLDYFGDGEYRVDPPVPDAPEKVSSLHTLVLSRSDVPLFFEQVSCRVMGLSLPVRVEMAIETSDGFRPMAGCCKPAG